MIIIIIIILILLESRLFSLFPPPPLPGMIEEEAQRLQMIQFQIFIIFQKLKFK